MAFFFIFFLGVGGFSWRYEKKNVPLQRENIAPQPWGVGKYMEKINFDKKNYRKHSDKNKRMIRKSLKDCGAGRSVLVDADGYLIAGNGVYEQAQKLNIPTRVVETDGSELVVVKRTDLRTEDAKRKELALADNATSDSVEWDMQNIAEDFDISVAEDWGIDLGEDIATDDNNGNDSSNISLTDRFIVPPFSILDASRGYWHDRKKKWKSMIGDNAESRENKLGGFKYIEKYGMKCARQSTSILDPVLSEVILRWFGIEGGTCFDTFAGDSVFGFVSSYLGYHFTGIELREEQVALNSARTKGMPAKYICDDGRNVLQHIDECSQDLFFSCPPYYDLEVYSDKSNDASNQETYEDFMAIIETAFAGAIKCLKQDRFAVVVCGDVRDKNGAYYCFPDDIKRVFVKYGCVLYNELILADPIGRGIYTAARLMNTRKVYKRHQNVLVFYKGDTKNIKNNYKNIEYASEDLEQFGLDEED